MDVLLLYHTKTGHTLEAVKAVVAGIRAAGAVAKAVAASLFDVGLLERCDGLIVASPCWAGSIGMGGIAHPLVRCLKHLPDGYLAGRRTGGIAVHSRFGGGRTVAAIGRRLMALGSDDYRPGPAVRAGAPFSLWQGPPVGEDDLRCLRDYGSAFVG